MVISQVDHLSGRNSKRPGKC